MPPLTDPKLCFASRRGKSAVSTSLEVEQHPSLASSSIAQRSNGSLLSAASLALALALSRPPSGPPACCSAALDDLVDDDTTRLRPVPQPPPEATPAPTKARRGKFEAAAQQQRHRVHRHTSPSPQRASARARTSNAAPGRVFMDAYRKHGVRMRVSQQHCCGKASRRQQQL